MPDFLMDSISAVVWFIAGWIACTLNAAMQRGLDRMFTPRPPVARYDDPERWERLRARAMERHRELRGVEVRNAGS